MASPSNLRQLAIKDTVSKIQSGTYKPDELITEAQICTTLNISRTPVREALIEMVKDGILVKIPQKGYMINEADQKYKLNIYDILGTLDALAAVLALGYLSSEDIRKMNEYIDLMDIAIKYQNYPAYYQHQEQFHQVYINNCDNPPLIQMLEQIKRQVNRYTYYSTDDSRLFETCRLMNDQHRHILRLITERDPQALRAYLEETHWETSIPDMI